MLSYSNETRAPPDSAQLEGTPTIAASYSRVRAVVWECGDGQTGKHTDRHTGARDHNTFRLRLARNVMTCFLRFQIS